MAFLNEASNWGFNFENLKFDFANIIQRSRKIAELGLAKTLECNDEKITHTIHAHPTLSEAVMEATLNVFQGAIHI